MKRSRKIPQLAPALTRRARFATAARNWKPLALIWRKTRHIASWRVARTGHVIVRNKWAPRFTLHIEFASSVAAPSKIVGYLPRTARATLWRELRTAVTTFRSIAKTLSTDRTRHLVERTVRGVAAHECTIRTWGRGADLRSFRARPLPSGAISSASRLQLALRPTGRASLRHATDATVWMKHSQVTSWTHHRSTRVRRSDHADSVFERSKPQRRLQPIRTPDLVWRSEPPPYTPATVERSISAAAPAVTPLGAAGPAPFEQPPGPWGASIAGVLDPAMIDRVADNVIGRVERRIRIERERRGA